MFRKKRFGLLLLICVMVLGSVLVGRWSITDVSAEGETYEKLKVFTEVLSAIKRNYVEEVEPETLIYDAVRGMLRSLDPHSAFLTPAAYKEMQVDTKGEFGGLGIQISIRNGVLTVIAPIEDTPAWRVGIEAGDRIIKIEDELTKDMTLYEAVSKMRGPKGKPVTITIVREGLKAPKDFTIIRDIIKIKSVRSDVLDEDIGYIKINQFQERTAADLAVVLKEMDKKNITSLILDLRNNPGGLLNSAVDVSSKFLAKGKLVVYIKGRSGGKTEYRTRGNTTYSKPMVVLVNQGSASASEIVAGALKDSKRAVILGVKTFGKGSVQSVIPLTDGSGLRLTTARYYTPLGTSIQTTGITPDIVVKLEPKEGVKEHVVIREKDLKGHLENDQGRGKKEEETEKLAVIAPGAREDDTQLQRAMDLLKTWTIFRELSPEVLPKVSNVPVNP